MHVNGLHLLGIALAILSAGVLSYGNIWQSRGVALASEQPKGRGFFLRLVRTPVWLLGTAAFGVAILLQMGSLAFAPIMLVQPIGVLALVFAVFLNARISGKKPSRAVINAIIVTLIGVIGYVAVAAKISGQSTITDGQLVAVLSTLGGVLLISALIRIFAHSATSRFPVLYVVIGGVFSAFVATLGKTVLLRIQALLGGHHFKLDYEGYLTLACLVGIAVASVLSTYFVQTAYTCNSSDVVVAGLTVIDPAIAVLLGIVILHEAANAPLWSLGAIAVTGAIAMYGVLRLSRAEDAPPAQPATTGAAPGQGTAQVAPDQNPAQ
ncbi:multidrug DMT transporter permease [Leucobacter sp. HY1908]